MIKRRLTFANVIACIALFVALGGASYAATQMPKESVGTKQLKAGAVTAAKVRSGSLLASNFATGQLPQGAKGDTGAAGPKGDRGDRGIEGQRGPRGESGVSGITTRYGNVVTLENGTASGSGAACAAGELATGGGYEFLAEHSIPPEANFRLWTTRPSITEPQMPPFQGLAFRTPAEGQAPTAWFTYMENRGAPTFEFRTYVVCAAI